MNFWECFFTCIRICEHSSFEACCSLQAVWFISGTQQHTALSTNWTAPNWCLALRALNLSALKSISVQENARCACGCGCMCVCIFFISVYGTLTCCAKMCTKAPKLSLQSVHGFKIWHVKYSTLEFYRTLIFRILLHNFILQYCIHHPPSVGVDSRIDHPLIIFHLFSCILW